MLLICLLLCVFRFLHLAWYCCSRICILVVRWNLLSLRDFNFAFLIYILFLNVLRYILSGKTLLQNLCQPRSSIRDKKWYICTFRFFWIPIEIQYSLHVTTSFTMHIIGNGVMPTRSPGVEAARVIGILIYF